MITGQNGENGDEIKGQAEQAGQVEQVGQAEQHTS